MAKRRSKQKSSVAGSVKKAPSRRHARPLVIVLCLLALVGGGVYWWQKNSPPEPPAIKVTGTDPAIIKAVEAGETQAADQLLPLVPQGGNTGMVGGGVALHGEVTLSLARMERIDDVDVADAQVTVDAGVTLAALHRAAAPHGLRFGVDIAPRDSCTIGGMVATNAGGSGVLRYGSMRRQVMGIEAVLGDASVVSHLRGLVKDNTGYDLAGLLCGSEGTLGVITRVRVALIPAATDLATFALGFSTLSDAIRAANVLRATLPVEAVEVMLADGVALVGDAFGVAIPEVLRSPVSLLVSFPGEEVQLVDVAPLLSTLVMCVDPVVVDGPAQRRLWDIRERHAEAINTLGPPVKLDITVPLRSMSAFVDSLPSLLPPMLRTFVFGHLGDGNLHVNVAGVTDDKTAHMVESTVLRHAVDHGGTISAEHGIGTAKAGYLHLCRSPAELALFGRIRRAFDPAGILNPHVLVPVG